MQTLTRNAEQDAYGGRRSPARGQGDQQARAASARGRRPWITGLAAVFAPLLGSPGCDNSMPAGGSSSIPPVSAPPQSTRVTAEQQPVDALHEMWQADTKGRLMVGGLSRWSRRLLFVAVAVTLAACDSASSEPDPSPIPHVSPGSPLPAVSTDPDSAVQAADQAYRGMWDAYLRVLAAPDPDSPELARYAAGNALKTLSDGVRDVRDQGLKGEGEFILSPQVTEVVPADAPNKISIRDCVDTKPSRIVRASPGPTYSDKPGGRRLCLATVQRQSDGSWKVTSFGLREVGTCT